ncbi:MAG: hypothetical protein ABSF10_12070 [Verrucomicrobiota bacterium]
MGQLDCALKIGGVNFHFNTIGEHFLGKRTDFVPLVKHGLKGVVNIGKAGFLFQSDSQQKAPVVM